MPAIQHKAVCSSFVDDAGPHEGCAEFIAPGTHQCPNTPTRLIQYEITEYDEMFPDDPPSTYVETRFVCDNHYEVELIGLKEDLSHVTRDTINWIWEGPRI